jgi:carboxymethylenebutenolidase
MGETIKLKASDGHELSAYRAAPSGTPRGGVLVIQEIFGVNSHIRRVADGFAQAGYLAIAPALFDRIRPGIEIGYTPEDVAKGIEFKGQCTTDAALLDVAAAIGEASKAGKVGVVGYCWGGFLAFMAACRLPGIAAASSYYGGGVAGALGETPHVPTIFHFGERDKHITMDHVAQVRAAFPHLNVFVYPADHGFNCDERASYDAPSADLARQRTLEFFADKVG